MENKILHGKPASQEQHTYIASLQLNDKHICSSGLFQEGFLLTSGTCAYYMMNSMTEKGKNWFCFTWIFGFKKRKKSRYFRHFVYKREKNG